MMMNYTSNPVTRSKTVNGTLSNNRLCRIYNTTKEGLLFDWIMPFVLRSTKYWRNVECRYQKIDPLYVPRWSLLVAVMEWSLFGIWVEWSGVEWNEKDIRLIGKERRIKWVWMCHIIEMWYQKTCRISAWIKSTYYKNDKEGIIKVFKWYHLYLL